ncbi:MAG: hypothetical protein WBA89_30375, partial [Microcoleus sp.]|uniref:hypothetical protein n=1 Tax=Microcoleus sp. TaxID=44472 RepID=UPI003C721FA3
MFLTHRYRYSSGQKKLVFYWGGVHLPGASLLCRTAFFSLIAIAQELEKLLQSTEGGRSHYKSP